MDEGGVLHACAVQRAFVYGTDNSYVLDAAREHSERLTPVVVLRADDTSTPATLRALAARQRLGGLRLASSHYDRLDTGWFNSPAAVETWRTAADLNLPVAIIFPPSQLTYLLPAIAVIAALFPALPIVIDHLGINHRANMLVARERALNLPDPYLGPPDFAISEPLKRLRSLPNVFFKLTSINFERLEEDGVGLDQFVRHFVGEFGADRLMWGSDIGQSEGAYTDLAAKARRATELLSAPEREQLLFGTAARLYRPG
jgi:predicted TIM-barrel fold metal-dependent hydrolase